MKITGEKLKDAAGEIKLGKADGTGCFSSDAFLLVRTFCSRDLRAYIAGGVYMVQLHLPC